MTDRHKEPPQAVRMPGGLKAWYRERAASDGQSLNSVLVAALEEFRARHDGATAAPRKPRQPKAAPAATFKPARAERTPPRASAGSASHRERNNDER